MIHIHLTRARSTPLFQNSCFMCVFVLHTRLLFSCISAIWALSRARDVLLTKLLHTLLYSISSYTFIHVYIDFFIFLFIFFFLFESFFLIYRVRLKKLILVNFKGNLEIKIFTSLVQFN